MKKDVPSELLGPWNALDLNQLKLPGDHKFIDRDRWIINHWERLHSWLPEYLYNEKLRFADISCGNGATMEILRHLGHDVFGTDFSVGFPDGEWMYRPMIVSQQLHCICHNGSDLPYPFPDNDFDVLINYGSMTFYEPLELWPDILNEFARMTRKCIFLCVNVGDIYDKGKHFIESWRHPEFELIQRQNSHYKWVRKQ